MLAKVKDRIEELMKKVPAQEDNYWFYFGHGEGWGDKCNRCMKKLEDSKEAYEEAVNCWKFEIWTENLTDIGETLVYLLEEADRDKTLHGKLMRNPHLIYEPTKGRLGSGISHSIPEEAKPDRYLNKQINGDRVILIYNQSIEERDRRMKKIVGDLYEKGLMVKDTAPYRRGCIQPHENIIGPWEKWYDLEKDYPRE
jgi:hypothetical protein